jgi:hypothetical protein
LFYVVDPLPKENGFGLDRESAVMHALGKLIGRAESRGLNALEVVAIAERHLRPMHRAKVEGIFRHVGDTPDLMLQSGSTEKGNRSLSRLKPRAREPPAKPISFTACRAVSGR